MKCSECPQILCTYRNVLRDKCWYVDEHISKELSELITNQFKKQMETENQAKVKPFYMVYVMGQSMPKKTYDNEQDASNEAKRLCDVERKSAYVLKTIKGYEFFSRVDDIEVEE